MKKSNAIGQPLDVRLPAGVVPHPRFGAVKNRALRQLGHRVEIDRLAAAIDRLRQRRASSSRRGRAIQ